MQIQKIIGRYYDNNYTSVIKPYAYWDNDKWVTINTDVQRKELFPPQGIITDNNLLFRKDTVVFAEIIHSKPEKGEWSFTEFVANKVKECCQIIDSNELLEFSGNRIICPQNNKYFYWQGQNIIVKTSEGLSGLYKIRFGQLNHGFLAINEDQIFNIVYKNDLLEKKQNYYINSNFGAFTLLENITPQEYRIYNWNNLTKILAAHLGITNIDWDLFFDEKAQIKPVLEKMFNNDLILDKQHIYRTIKRHIEELREDDEIIKIIRAALAEELAIDIPISSALEVEEKVNDTVESESEDNLVNEKELFDNSFFQISIENLALLTKQFSSNNIDQNTLVVNCHADWITPEYFYNSYGFNLRDKAVIQVKSFLTRDLKEAKDCSVIILLGANRANLLNYLGDIYRSLTQQLPAIIDNIVIDSIDNFHFFIVNDNDDYVAEIPDDVKLNIKQYNI